MVLSNEKKREYRKRLLMSRMRLLINHGFYGLLLMHMEFSLDEGCKTAATDGRRIYFHPDFLEVLNDTELDFVLMHEVLHVVLQHCLRLGEREQERFNIACDIVVNSQILLSKNNNPNAITIRKFGEAMHLAPNGKEGHNYTAEQIYEMLSSSGKEEGDTFLTGILNSNWDNHGKWGKVKDAEELKEIWTKHFREVCEVIKVRDPSDSQGLLPLFAKRMLKELKVAKTDWRTILHDFVQEEIVDYSFYPPDRRFHETPYFLPDFNEKDDFAEDILFMIDTSGSMSDDMITRAYSEVKGALEQFNGKLRGWLGFFDAAVVEPKPFSEDNELEIIKPKGGGGTSFRVVFEYVQKNMGDKLPISIIILTDGFAPFPDQAMAGNIPVLWLLNNDTVQPPWGKVARM